MYCAMTFEKCRAAQQDVDMSGRDWVGLALWLFGWGLEAVSDQQKFSFRNNPANKGRFCGTCVCVCVYTCVCVCARGYVSTEQTREGCVCRVVAEAKLQGPRH